MKLNWNIAMKFISIVAATLLLTFVGIGFTIIYVLQSSNDRLVQAILFQIEKGNDESVRRLQNEFEQIETSLKTADQGISGILNEQFNAACQRTMQSLANRIYPLIQDFDYEAAKKVIQDALKSNEEIKWLYAATRENPKDSDIFQAGEKLGNEMNGRIFHWKSEKGATYLKMEMHVSEKGVSTFLDKVKNTFQEINGGTEGLVVQVKDAGMRSMNHTVGVAKTIEAKSRKIAIKWISLLMASGLFLVCVIIWFIMKRSFTKPIKRVIKTLDNEATSLASASEQVSSASQSLAEGSSEQAASLEETSASLDEMSSMTKQNADNARQADTLMGETRRVVSNANESMESLIGSMAEIAKASEETSKIVKTIDEIAFQTNLLALNAAVEAARAGEAGAGFAVVADEVRNLAMRAAEAAKTTATLIEGTVKKVKEGSSLVSTTNEDFHKVAESAAKVADLVGDIAAALGEQAQGIEEVNKAVTEMDRVTQSNAANAEESASASEELNAQAEQMQAMVSELVKLVDGSKAGGYRKEAVREKTPSAAAPRRTGSAKRALAAPAGRTRAEKR